jgi:hypothetical protein
MKTNLTKIVLATFFIVIIVVYIIDSIFPLKPPLMPFPKCVLFGFLLLIFSYFFIKDCICTYKNELKKDVNYSDIGGYAPDEEPKPELEKTLNIIEEIVLINNTTDKEYRVKSDNDFGLGWVNHGTEEIKQKLLSINQLLNFDDDRWETGYIAKGRYYGFSIADIKWKKVEVKRETENDLWVKK